MTNSGSSSFCGLIEPKHYRLQAPVAVAESMLAHDTWRGGVRTLSKLKYHYFTSWMDKRRLHL